MSLRFAFLSLALPIFTLLFLGCAPVYHSRKPLKEEPTVRVALAHHLPLVVIEARDTVWATDGNYTSPVVVGKAWTIYSMQGRLRAETGAGTIISDIGPKLVLRGKTSFFWNGQLLAWPLTITPETDSTLLIVAELPLEEYLTGVLSREMGNVKEAELEALKAQAVAARGYAYVKIGRRPDQGYDLESDIIHQAFDPSPIKNHLIRKAVEKTRGQVMVCRGRVFAPNYHSTCGGRTALPSEVWGTVDNLSPWAKSVKCDLCRISPRYQWNVVLFPGELARRALGLADTTIPVTDLKIMERGPWGRVQKLMISSQAGDTILYRDRIRFQLADKSLPSSWFDISCRRDDFGNVIAAEFSGKGFGHGVGMCQWGAIGMAWEGKKYKKILKHYYQDVELTRIY